MVWVYYFPVFGDEQLDVVPNIYFPAGIPE